MGGDEGGNSLLYHEVFTALVAAAMQWQFV